MQSIFTAESLPYARFHKDDLFAAGADLGEGGRVVWVLKHPFQKFTMSKVESF